MNKGKDFEALVALVEKAVHNLPGVEVLHDVKLPTKYGGERQIDIVLKEIRGRFIYLTIIECKNTNAKVTVNMVGAFKELKDSVSAHQGIFVSASGFQSGALLSAKDENIFLTSYRRLRNWKNTCSTTGSLCMS
ncbi:MAG: restriction endonuclease [Chitinophagaceae bacterium]